MRLFLTAGAVLTLGLLACTPAADDPSAQLAAQCADERLDETRRIDACTALLDTPELEQDVRIDALAQRGEARRRSGKPTEALADFNAALELAPTLSAAQLGKAEILIESGQLDAATVLLDAVIARGDGGARAHYLRGNLLMRGGNVAGALEDYDSALQADPRLAAAYAQRGLAKQSYEEFSSARSDFDEAINLDSDNAPARAGRCWNRLLREEDANAARADAEAAIRADANLLAGHMCLGMAALKLENWQLARTAYEAAVARDPSNPEALYGRGVASIRQGERREGNDDVDQAQRFNSRADATFRRLDVEL